MTNTPIRPIVYTVCEPIENPTLRQLVEWSKRVTAAVQDKDPSTQELRFIQQAWGAMVDAKAAEEAIPSGFLSYMLQELQISEQQLVDQAMQDAGF